jgi:uncharacterized protein YjbI with pentapeptide repeats
MNITHRRTAAIIYTSEKTTMKETVCEAVAVGADLSRAYLSGADLSGAYLYGADLSGANLYRADLSGAKVKTAQMEMIVKALRIMVEP